MPPRILLLDAYDSFTANLASLLRTTTHATVHTLPIDALDPPTLLRFLPSFDAVVAGPGPGHPSDPAAVGLTPTLWHLPDHLLLPVLGVCLGHQSLCLAFAGTVAPLRAVKHGLVSPLTHTGSDLFAGVGPVHAVRYHSLHATPGNLQPHAWAHDPENGPVLMAARHPDRPFWGLQYHPESICTVGGGAAVLHNWWRMAQAWNHARARRPAPIPHSWPGASAERGLLARQREWEVRCGVAAPSLGGRRAVVTTRVVAARGLPVPRIAELLGAASADEFLLLDSAAAPGRWCVVAVLTPGVTRVITHSVGDPFVALSTAGAKDRDRAAERVSLAPYEGDVWRFLARYMHARTATGGCAASPFWGGLVGYFSYEVGVAALGVPVPPRDGAAPKAADVCLAFARRSIAVDTHTGRAYIQTLHPGDTAWLSATAQTLQLAADMATTPSATPQTHSPVPPATQQYPEILRPSRPRYLAAIAAAQAHLAAGDSYELCLTAATTILHPRPAPHPWTLYTSLRARNPAPHAAYLRLAGTTLLSSSPERFLSWTRTGLCQLRPIKGTVRKGVGVTRESAERALRAPKEVAENLMIVDLIRHDLHRLAGDTVVVARLMHVEEYAHVFQLVSVVEGAVARGVSGFDVLAASLPAGSMTGAPKRRSVQLLHDIEGGAARGVYSGVVGYWSVCGAGDWSVVIRSAVRVDGEVAEGCDVWRIGAGGAITALSVPEEEWEEMGVKAESALRAFVG